MKKIFYSLMTVAALLTAASCQKEFTNSPDPAYGGKPVVTTFNVDLGVTTKALESSTLDDGTTVDKLYVAAFAQADGSLVSTSLVGANAASISNKTATVKLTLSKGQAYDIVFFAMKDGAYDVTFSNGPTATFSYKSGAKANDPTLDAFYKKVSVASASTTQESVTLKRPFAQINVLSSNAPDGAISSKMTVKGVPTTFDLFNEAAGTETTDLAFAENAISAPAFGKYANDYTWLAMNFVLPNQAGLVELSFQATQMTDAVTVKNVAVKKNGRTNLIGAIYDLDAEITYTVTVDPIFGEEGEGDLNDTETTIVTPTTYTANNPLVIDVSNGVRPASVTLTVNDGDSFSDIESGAAGGVIEAKTSDDKVATAEVDKTNNAVKITPVGNGDAVITVTTPRYTKAFSAGSIEIPVHVTGFSAEAEDPTLTISGAPTAATAEPFTLTVDTNSDGEISWMVDPAEAATVAAGTKAGEYVVTPATDLAEDTQATVTFTVAATDAYNEASESVEFTVAGEGGGSGDSGTADNPYTVAEAIAAVADLTWTSNTEYEKTDEVYVKGIICSIANNGTYGQSGTFGNASYYISDDGSDTGDKFYVYRSLYFNNEKYTSGQDIKVGDTVVICGKLMNYKGNTPETVANESYLYSLTAGADIESSISVDDMTVEVGKTKTIQPTVNPSNAVVTYTTTSSAITIDGNKVTGVSEGSATVTANIAAVEGSYTASSTTFTVIVTAASGGDATVLWEETWSGATDGQLMADYAFGGTSVYGGGSVSYSSVGGTKIFVDNNMDGSTKQENLMLGKKVDDVSGTWTITGIPTGNATKAILKIYTNNANTFKSDLITLTSSTSGVSIGAKTQGEESAKPFTFTFEIEFGSAKTFDLTFTNGHSQNVRIDDITLTAD